MDRKNKLNNKQTHLFTLSLKKNAVQKEEKREKMNRSSDCIIIDESFDKLRADFPQSCLSPHKVYSPIVIEDSCNYSDELHDIDDEQPSKSGNVSLNLSECQHNKSEPSLDGWSPKQNIICATPRIEPEPSNPSDKLNESQEHCSMEKIQKSHQKLLEDIYGHVVKIVPKLKDELSIPKTVPKKLIFDDDKENTYITIKKNRELYLTESQRRKIRHETDMIQTEKKSKKKLYTETIPSTPDIERLKPYFQRDVKTTVKKRSKALTVTELVKAMDDTYKPLTENINIPPKKKNDKLETPISNDKVSKTKTTKTQSKPPNLGVDTFKDFDKFETPISNNKVTKTKTTKTQSKPNLGVGTPKDNDKLLKNNAKNIENITKSMNNLDMYHTPENKSERLSFMASLADNIPPWRCHPEAIQYHDNFKNLRDQLVKRLYEEFNREVFKDQLDKDMSITWSNKMRTTAGITANRQIKKSSGVRLRASRIQLSSKVLDNAQRTRDTVIHELCHAATWLIDGELRDGHGPLWRKWCKEALRVFPELGEISRCHNMSVHYKYCYKCTKCGYSIQRHSKSIDITKKVCGYCYSKFEIIVNKKNKDGVVIATPARKAPPSEFAIFVKDNYSEVRKGRDHGEAMKVLAERFAAQKKTKNDDL